jgi:hypothetical protein
VDLIDRARELKGELVEFGTSPRFRRELSGVIARNYPDGVGTDDGVLTVVIDYFLLQHRLPTGGTVVEAFLNTRRGLSDDEREMLLGWRDVVEGIFEITGKDRDSLTLFNLLDELTYRARSNLGRDAFRPLKKGSFLLGRLVPLGGDWMVSGHMSTFPGSARREILAIAAEQAMRRPAAVFRNPAKLAEARQVVAERQAAFVEFFGSDLIVVPGPEVASKVAAFRRHMTGRVNPEGDQPDLPAVALPERLLADDGAALYHDDVDGLCFVPGYRLLDELFHDPALLSRGSYRETLSGYLRDPNTSPEPLRRLADRDPARASVVFGKLLNRKRGFSWEADGEQLLRQNKPSYFDGSRLPSTVTLSKPLSEAYQASQAEKA